MAIGKATLEAKVKELQERIEALEGGCHQDLPSTQFFNSSKEKNNEPAPFLSLEKQKTFKEKEEERIANKPVTKVIEEHFGGLSADGLEYVWFGDDFPIWACDKLLFLLCTIESRKCASSKRCEVWINVKAPLGRAK